MKKFDSQLALIFGILTLTFIVLMFNDAFFDWAFRRHQNQLSWFSRPLFLIPYCYFAYKRSMAGIFFSLFAMLTSMFWFPPPEAVDGNVKRFLAFEKQYLTESWSLTKTSLALIVPISLFLLALAFWKRNLKLGIFLIISIALGKVGWSIYNAGESGYSIIIPATIGLFLCVAIIFGFRMIFRKN